MGLHGAFPFPPRLLLRCATLVALSILLLQSCSGLELRFGQTSSLTGPRAYFGQEYCRGVSLAFQEANTNNVHENTTFVLIVKDDESNQTLSRINAQTLIESDQVFGLIGPSGSQATSEVLALLADLGLPNFPIIGPLSGSKFLRVPFRSNIVNIRASFIDETAAIVSHLSSERLTRVAVICQDDVVGQNVLNGLTISLSHFYLSVVSNGSFSPNATDEEVVDTAHEALHTTHVQALILYGDASKIALIVQHIVVDHANLTGNLKILITSDVDPFALTSTLRTLNVSTSLLYFTHLVPHPIFSTLKLASRYRDALALYEPGITPTPASLEGYLVGQLIIDTLDRVRGNLTQKSFLDAIYRTGVYYSGGVTLGPYLNLTQSKCNQGMREVFLAHFNNDTWTFEPVQNFSFTWSDTCLSSASTVLETKSLLWGQTAVFSGWYGILGNEVASGITAAFREANRNKTVPGYSFQLLSLEDGLVGSVAAQNAAILAKNHNVMGLVGCTGIATSRQAYEAANAVDPTLPFVGAPVGATGFRIPFKRNLINVRASSVDEATGIIHFLTNRLISRISVLYQDSESGRSGKDGMQRAMDDVSLKFESVATISTITSDVRPGMDYLLTSSTPGAILIAAPPDITAEAIAYGRTVNKIGASCYYFTMSSIPTEMLHEKLMALNQSLSNVYATMVVPSVFNTSNSLVATYHQALFTVNPDATPTLWSLEGYLAGRLIVEVTSRISGEPSRAAFLDALYDDQIFVLSRNRIGPYDDSSAHPCSQGLQSVWVGELSNSSESILNIPSDGHYTWTGSCMSSSETFQTPIVFGQSVPLSGPTASIGISMRNGVLAAFNRFNRNGGLNGRQVRLRYYDDGYNTSQAAVNAKEMLDDSTIALLGFVGTPTSLAALNYSEPLGVPFIAPFTGANTLRTPCVKTTVSLRSSYEDECASMISFLVDDQYISLRKGRTFHNIGIIYQNDAYGKYYEGIEKAMAYHKMTLSGIGSYTINNEDVEQALANITRNTIPDAIIMFCTYRPGALFLQLAQSTLPTTTVFISISFTGAEFYAHEISRLGLRLVDPDGHPVVYISSVMPSYMDSSLSLANEFVQEISLIRPVAAPNAVSFEGYAAGRFATRVLQLIEGPVSRQNFLDAIYEKFNFNLGGYFVGPYQMENWTGLASAAPTNRCACSQGSHEVWMSYVDSNYTVRPVDGYSFTFYDSCGYLWLGDRMQRITPAMQYSIVALSTLAIILTVLSGIMVILYRQTKTMSAASPTFLLIILVGALLLAISPMLAFPWGPVGNTSNRICMSWIWFLGLGFTLFFAPLAVKTYRVYRIFTNHQISHSVKLRDSDLTMYIVFIVAFEVILLIVWTVVAPAQLISLPVPGTLDHTVLICTRERGEDQPFIIVQSLFFGIMAAVACVFAVKVRRIKYGAFNESVEILFAVYNLTFLSVILVPIHAALTLFVIPSTFIRTFGVLFQVVVSLIALFGMKLYRIITNNERMSTSSGGRPTTTSGPSHTNTTSTPRDGQFSSQMVSYKPRRSAQYPSEMNSSMVLSEYSYPASAHSSAVRSETGSSQSGRGGSEVATVVAMSDYDQNSVTGRSEPDKLTKMHLHFLETLSTLPESDSDSSLSDSGPQPPKKKKTKRGSVQRPGPPKRSQ